MRPGGQSLANQQTAQVGIDQHRAVSVPPIEREQTALRRFEFGRLRFEILVNVLFGFFRSLAKCRWDAVLHVPGEEIAHPRLPRLVAPEAGNHPVLHHAANALHRFFALGGEQMAGTGAHDHNEFAGIGDRAGRHGGVGVDVGCGDRRAGGKSHRLCHFWS